MEIETNKIDARLAPAPLKAAPTLENEVLEFLKVLEAKKLGGHTLKNYRADLVSFVNFYQPIEITGFLSEFRVELLKQFDDHLHKQGLRPNTIRRKWQTIRLFFDFLVAKEVVEKNWAKVVVPEKKVLNIPTPPPPKDIQKCWRFFEKRRMELASKIEKIEKKRLAMKIPLKSLKQHKAFEDRDALIHEYGLLMRNRLLFGLIYWGGLKTSHLENLKWFHYIPDDDSPRILVQTTKNDSISIPMPSLFNLHVNQYNKALTLINKNRRPKKNSPFLMGANRYGTNGKPLSARGIENIFEKISEAQKVHITARQLRQGCILKWFQERQPESTIKEWMGVAPQYSLSQYKKYLDQFPPYQAALLV